MVGEPKLMKEAGQLKSGKAALASRAAQWVKESESDRENADARIDALQNAANVGDLANMKATSGLEDSVFAFEKAKLARLAWLYRQLTRG